jgi:hypothetical protein
MANPGRKAESSHLKMDSRYLRGLQGIITLIALKFDYGLKSEFALFLSHFNCFAHRWP